MYPHRMARPAIVLDDDQRTPAQATRASGQLKGFQKANLLTSSYSSKQCTRSSLSLAPELAQCRRTYVEWVVEQWAGQASTVACDELAEISDASEFDSSSDVMGLIVLYSQSEGSNPLPQPPEPL
jgi:hypothetical protein